MQRWGDNYRTFISGKWGKWTTYQEASRQEADELHRQVQAKLAAGGTVILSKGMAKKIEPDHWH